MGSSRYHPAATRTPLLMPLGIDVGADKPAYVTVCGLRARPGCPDADPAARG